MRICNALFSFFTFCYARVVETLVSGPNFRNRVFVGNARFKAPEFENHVFSGLPLCEAYQHYSKTNNCRKFKFSILFIHHAEMLLETFYEDYANRLHIVTRKIISIHCGLWAVAAIVGNFWRHISSCFIRFFNGLSKEKKEKKKLCNA